MKKTRKKRVITVWQTKDQGADPLTPRGRKWIEREIKACDTKKLRKQLESQSFNDTGELDYWEWMAYKGYRDADGFISESYRANPDMLSDEDIME